MLEEVIVTAQKRAENLQDVPIAVTTLDGEKIAEMGIHNIQDLALYVPNFHQTPTATSNVIYIRGIGSGPNPSFEQSVGMFMDGIYWGRGRQTLAPLFDLQRVEVLKGPQGILFGKNTVAGAVSIIAVQPSAKSEIYIEVSNGGDGENEISAALGGAISDRINGRLALHYRETGGYVKNVFNNRDGPNQIYDAARLGLNFDNEDNLRVYLKLEYANLNTTGQAYELIQYSPIDADFTLTGVQVTLPPQLQNQESDINFRTNFGNSEFASAKGVDGTLALQNHVLRLNYDLGGFTLTSLTGFSAYDFFAMSDLDLSPVDIVGAVNTEDFRQWSQELRLESPIGGALETIGGLYLQANDVEIDTVIPMKISNIIAPINPPSDPFGTLQKVLDNEGDRLSYYEVKAKSAAIFLQATLNLTDHLRLTLGGRYTYEKKQVEKNIAVRPFANSPGAFGDTTVACQDVSNPAYDTLLNEYWLSYLDVYPYCVKRSRTERKFTPPAGCRVGRE